MRNVLLAVSAISGLAAALPQRPNFEAAKALPLPSVELLKPKVDEKPNAPIKYNQPAAVQEVKQDVSNNGVQTRKRSTSCSGTVEAGGAAPVPGDGSAGAYLATTNNVLKSNADGATAPAGYDEAFKGLNKATQQIGYLTYKNIETGNYNVQACADFCDSEKFCLGFNIYYERDPKYAPSASCTDPEPQTNLKCALFGYPVSANTAINDGQYREQFQVVIAGSNGYSKRQGTVCRNAPVVPRFNAPTQLPAAIDAPYITKNNREYYTYNGMRLFNENPYDPSLCAAACEAQTAFDKEHLVDASGEYRPCNFFTSYILTQNDVPLGTYCALYTQTWGPEYATNTGYHWESDEYRTICAASYSLTAQDSGRIATPTI
ncbi:hypothetical protein COCSADRAFT_189863 [Bipolaris sorokiniana ND90Pr]|uniref:Apple domain-containing protein n=1 Tax=Cochliobolus sativus (strain ND90Pr / ATCC 201652) TaxID=665912 RepID=M2T773_COCSN|nr:uncharacterized protein COCSADRAFT_189863 [Bipolaris sorokiniana ND90Pr]EMD64827.1 hypothetical protein COCSADRAFT_189863 [Bipolaris sorokiniana ND90Pr]